MIPLDTPAPRFVNRSLLANPAAAGRIAQRESVPFTRERSKVRSLVRPPHLRQSVVPFLLTIENVPGSAALQYMPSR
jgi:hypothetical protein